MELIRSQLKAVITDGDIRRAMMKGYDENSRSGDIANYCPFFLNLFEATEQKINDAFETRRIKAVPIRFIVQRNKRFWKDIC